VHYVTEWTIYLNLNRTLVILPWTGVIRTQNAKPGIALYPRLYINRAKQMNIWIGAVHEMWKYPMQKSILETSVLMIPTSLPVVNPPLVRA